MSATSAGCLSDQNTLRQPPRDLRARAERSLLLARLSPPATSLRRRWCRGYREVRFQLRKPTSYLQLRLRRRSLRGRSQMCGGSAARLADDEVCRQHDYPSPLADWAVQPLNEELRGDRAEGLGWRRSRSAARATQEAAASPGAPLPGRLRSTKSRFNAPAACIPTDAWTRVDYARNRHGRDSVVANKIVGGHSALSTAKHVA